ncbi:hypothetical protein DID88_007933 [Monilinia fructigena]|uniref:BTB domain-containing protein n=1 Tax=Monilinia fructigena TaxID=38457 RepID=A0A395J3Q2_9HELO|nr:hypothetical protein DID88_007933 [Monilinia fructigena]
MSNLLWKYYLEDDVDKFRRQLANATHFPHHTSKGHGGGSAFSSSFGNKVGSSGGLGTSPKTFSKNRKISGSAGNIGGNKGNGNALSRMELNGKDHAGLTVLHRAASSTSTNAILFATALIEHPSIDLYIQDTESGWTALHRALYFGNITIARAIIERDSKDRAAGNTGARPDSSVIKVKDREGNTPFDVYNATIARRSLKEGIYQEWIHFPDDDEDDDGLDALPSGKHQNSKALTVMKSMHSEATRTFHWVSVTRMIVISNLYMCGFGPGGRLGMGDETTRFNYMPVDQGGLAGKKVETVALGQKPYPRRFIGRRDFQLGTNTWGQLGYNLPRPSLKDDEPVCHNPAPNFWTFEKRNYCRIESGGDTIAAISGRGDLFTLNVRKIDTKVSASTTNPTKMKEALSQPQRVWSLRKGNWDGIRSVGVAENGSVIVCTQAGAVWRRIKRAKNKDAFTGINDYNRKDFKFQRVPGLTQVAAYSRSRAFRGPVKLSAEVMRFAASKGYDSVRAAVIKSQDLEADVNRLLMGYRSGSDGHDVEICSSISDIAIPIHGFILAGRSSVLRSLLTEFRSCEIASIPDLLNIEHGAGDKIKITLYGLDVITLVNFVIYLYTDKVVDVWNFTKFFPSMAYRLRQVRAELMKLSSQLKMPWLEAPVRMIVQPSDKLNCDLDNAITDEAFFDDCDAIVELDGGERPIHSVLICRRCPFFDGLFNGRSAGQWLAGRRAESTEAVRIDLKHIAPETFELVLRYLYADVGPELFDNIVSADIDEFSELVMDVMSVANELMIDRLSQICQQVLGRFVNTRNVCSIVNAVAPCSVTELKDAGLEYMCLQLESILENHLLDDLDEDLVLELDEVVRDNQLNCLPFSKSGRADLDLHEKYPELAEDIDEERRRRVGDMTFRAQLRDDDNKISSSFKARMGSLDDTFSSPSQEKSKRKSRVAKNEPFSPSIRPKDSVADLMFDMDDDEGPGSPHDLNLALDPTSASPGGPTTPRFFAASSTPKILEPGSPSELPNSVGLGIQYNPDTPQPGTKTWSSPNLSLKLDMKEIMAQASTSPNAKSSTPKLSQKERKKQQAAFQQAVALTPADKGKDKPSSPWQIAGVGSKANLNDIINKENKSSSSSLASKAANTNTSSTARRIASQDTRFAGQKRDDGSSITKTQSSSPGMQQREQEVIKEAVAKRSLQEIQEEQAFQEWWDQESKRAQEEEASRSKASTSGSARGNGKSGGGRGKGGSRGRGGRGRGGGDSVRGTSGNGGGGRGRGKFRDKKIGAI